MKRTYFLLGITLMVSAALLMTACKKEDTNSGNTPDGGAGGGDTTFETWVDLGLPSGLLWASYNLGAQKPEEFGNYYAWGETSPKEVYGWDNYAYGMSTYELTKYCGMPLYGLYYYHDSLTTLEPSDDAAAVNLGDGARIPTKNEWEELQANTDKSWITRNGVHGCLLTATNGNSIFLPAAGCREDSTLNYVGNSGGYWSSSLMTNGPCNSWQYYIHSNGDVVKAHFRCKGFSVRAVRASQN